MLDRPSNAGASLLLLFAKCWFWEQVTPRDDFREWLVGCCAGVLRMLIISTLWPSFSQLRHRYRLCVRAQVKRHRCKPGLTAHKHCDRMGAVVRYWKEDKPQGTVLDAIWQIDRVFMVKIQDARHLPDHECRLQLVPEHLFDPHAEFS